MYHQWKSHSGHLGLTLLGDPWTQGQTHHSADPHQGCPGRSLMCCLSSTLLKPGGREGGRESPGISCAEGCQQGKASGSAHPGGRAACVQVQSGAQDGTCSQSSPGGSGGPVGLRNPQHEGDPDIEGTSGPQRMKSSGVKVWYVTSTEKNGIRILTEMLITVDFNCLEERNYSPIQGLENSTGLSNVGCLCF